MTPGFQSEYTGTTKDGKNWVAGYPLLQYQSKAGAIYRIKLGATTDGPSVPEFAAALEWGKVWLCGVLHDACYRDQIEVCGDGGGWFPYHPTKDESDEMFDEAMEVSGVNPVERVTFFRAVVIFGKKAFRDDRAVESNPS